MPEAPSVQREILRRELCLLLGGTARGDQFADAIVDLVRKLGWRPAEAAATAT